MALPYRSMSPSYNSSFRVEIITLNTRSLCMAPNTHRIMGIDAVSPCDVDTEYPESK